MQICLYVKYTLFSSDLNETWIVWNISLPKYNSERYYRKCKYVCMWSTHYSRQILKKHELYEIFRFLSTIQQDITANANISVCEVPIILVRS